MNSKIAIVLAGAVGFSIPVLLLYSFILTVGVILTACILFVINSHFELKKEEKFTKSLEDRPLY